MNSKYMDTLKRISIEMKRHRKSESPAPETLNGETVMNLPQVSWGSLQVGLETNLTPFKAYALAGDGVNYTMIGVEYDSEIYLLDPEWGQVFNRKKCPYSNYMRQNEDGSWRRF